MQYLNRTILLFLMLLTALAILQSCQKDDDPDTDPDVNDTTDQNQPDSLLYSFTEIKADSTFMVDRITDAPEARRFLLEEFTGVQCTNCPAAHDAVAEITASQSDVYAIAIHAGDLAEPIDADDTDLRISEGQDLASYFQVTGIPVAMINRHYFIPEYSVPQYNKNTWAPKLEQLRTEISDTAPVNLHLYHDFDNSTGLLQVYVQVLYTEDVSTDHRLSIVLTEDNVEGRQEIPEEVIDYSHQHVLRHYLTPYSGQILGTTVAANTVVIKKFAFQIPDSYDWKEENLNILSFVHGWQAEADDIWQVSAQDL